MSNASFKDRNPEEAVFTRWLAQDLWDLAEGFYLVVWPERDAGAWAVLRDLEHAAHRAVLAGALPAIAQECDAVCLIEYDGDTPVEEALRHPEFWMAVELQVGKPTLDAAWEFTPYGDLSRFTDSHGRNRAVYHGRRKGGRTHQLVRPRELLAWLEPQLQVRGLELPERLRTWLREASSAQEAARTSAPEADAGWLRVGEAAERAGVKACAISQAVKRGLLVSNGKKGTRRRICPKSFEGHLQRRGREDDESYYL